MGANTFTEEKLRPNARRMAVALVHYQSDLLSARVRREPGCTVDGYPVYTCNDGSEYTGASKRGACRGHKGVKEWFADKQAPTATAVATPKPAVEPTPAAGPAVIPPPPQPKPSAQPASVPAQTAPAPAAGSGKVWVNTKSKIYHCEGTKFYGNTKAGEYMSEADAIAKGNKANRNKACK